VLVNDLRVRMFKIGRGIGHTASDLVDVVVVVVVVLLLLLPPDTSAACCCCCCSRIASIAATCRRLLFNASALGHDRASKIRRTARLEALFKARVNDKPTMVISTVFIVVVVVVVVVGTSFPSVRVVRNGTNGAVIEPYARDNETSAGAIQKSISFTFPRLEVLMLVEGVVVVTVEVVVEDTGISAVRSDADDIVTCCCCNSCSIGGCSISAPVGGNTATSVLPERYRYGGNWSFHLSVVVVVVVVVVVAAVVTLLG
jgi:hypothetical protein